MALRDTALQLEVAKSIVPFLSGNLLMALSTFSIKPMKAFLP
jgi:hypothetical protein